MVTYHKLQGKLRVNLLHNNIRKLDWSEDVINIDVVCTYCINEWQLISGNNLLICREDN